MYNILVIDDSRDMQDLIATSLSEEDNIEVTNVSDGHSALDLIDKQKFQLIIMDIGLPFLSGFEIAARLKRTNESKEIPILFISSRNRPRDIQRAIEIGAIGYQLKPFSPKEIRQKVTQVLADL